MTRTPKAPATIRALALILLILLPLSALGARFGLWPYTIGLLLLSISLLGSLLIQIINAFWLLRKPEAATKSALRIASLLALPPLVVISLVLTNSDSTRANIHDISTDLNNPPLFVAAIQERGADSNSLALSAEVADIQRQAFPDIAPLSSDKAADQAFAHALATAQALGWDILAQDETQGRIEAVDTTFWFGFKDDIVIRITPTKAGSIIDLRSVSRVGKSDLGANANRIRLFQQEFIAN